MSDDPEQVPDAEHAEAIDATPGLAPDAAALTAEVRGGEGTWAKGEPLNAQESNGDGTRPDMPETPEKPPAGAAEEASSAETPEAPAPAGAVAPLQLPAAVAGRASSARPTRRRRVLRLLSALAALVLLATALSGVMISRVWFAAPHAKSQAPALGSANPQSVDAAAATAAALGNVDDALGADLRQHHEVYPPFDGMMVLGDSVTEGYTLASPSQHYTVALTRDLGRAGLLEPGAFVRELGVPALSLARAVDWLNSHPTTAAENLWNSPHPPDLVVLQLGLNDWLHNQSTRSQYTQGLTHLLHVLQAHAAPQAMLVCLTPWGGAPGTNWDGTVPDGAGITIPEYSAMLIPICNSAWSGPVVIADMAPLIANRGLHNVGLDQHPNAAGHQAIAATIFAAIEAYIKKWEQRRISA